MMVPSNSFPFKRERKFTRSRPSMMMAFTPSFSPRRAPTGSTGAWRPGLHFRGNELAICAPTELVEALRLGMRRGIRLVDVRRLARDDRLARAEVGRDTDRDIIGGPSRAPSGRDRHGIDGRPTFSRESTTTGSAISRKTVRSRCAFSRVAWMPSQSLSSSVTCSPPARPHPENGGSTCRRPPPSRISSSFRRFPF